jgi:hypothetical protein
MIRLSSVSCLSSEKEIEMTVEQLSQYAGVVLSLALAYIPKLAEWYAAKDAQAKARIMGGLLVLTAVGIFALACAHIAGDLGLGVACDKASLMQLVQILLSALIANQATFLLAVKPFKR